MARYKNQEQPLRIELMAYGEIKDRIAHKLIK